jgi:hypothetical protein
MNRAQRREMAAELARENARWPVELVQVPRIEWPLNYPATLLEAWRSCNWLVQVHREGAAVRLSVCRAAIEPRGERWADGITWDDLQRLKRECGRGDCDAVEIYPADRDIVNVANMRHLWLVERETLPFAWRKP